MIDVNGAVGLPADADEDQAVTGSIASEKEGMAATVFRRILLGEAWQLSASSIDSICQPHENCRGLTS